MKKNWACLLLLPVVFAACGGKSGNVTNPIYTVTYNGNGATGGSVPIDANNYAQGKTVTVLGNTGNLVKTGYSFTAWNTLANGTGATYTPGQTFTMDGASVILYAQWTANTAIGYAYVANLEDPGTGGVSQYTIGADGALTPMNPATVATGNIPSCVTVDPSGKYAYVTNTESNPGSVSQYTIGTNGALTPMNPATVITAGIYPDCIAVVPSAKYAYVGNDQSSDVSEFADGANGALTLIDTIREGAGYPNAPVGIAVDPSGKYLYMANADGNCISQFTIGAAGALTPMNPDSALAGPNVHSVTVHPSGKYLYATTYDSGTVLAFAIGANGALTRLSRTLLPTASFPLFATVDPSGKYLYVGNSASPTAAISQYTIGSDGSLTPMTPPAVSAAGGANCVTVDPSGKYVYATTPNGVAQFTIGAGGALTPMTPATVQAGSGPIFIITVKN